MSRETGSQTLTKWPRLLLRAVGAKVGTGPETARCCHAGRGPAHVSGVFLVFEATLVAVERRVGIVTDEGAPRTLLGRRVRIGDSAPDFDCVVQDRSTLALESVKLADTPPVVRVFSVVPSLDTPVCAIQTARFDAAVAKRAPAVAAYAVSVDTPYAMERVCCRLSGTVRALSDYRPERSFGHAWGVLLEETGELARAVFIVDAQGTVVYAEIAADLANHPDYDAALAAIDRTTSS
jgi:thiol peroxidase